MQTPHPNTAPRTPDSLEQGISRSLAEMRAIAAEAWTDDFFDNWSRAVMDRRPVIFVAVAMPGQTLSWLMEPDAEGVLSAGVNHLSAGAELGFKTKLVDTIAGDVGWLVKEATGSFPTD
jgi:hypothetical protein